MTDIRGRVAHAVLRLAAALSPPDRREWHRAMQAELQYLPVNTALAFGFGCLWAMAKARATASSTILNVARWALVLGALAWSALHVRLAGQLSVAGATTPSMLAYFAAAVIALGAVLTAAKGLRIAVIMGAPVIVAACLVAIGAEDLVPRSTAAHFYRAIAVEYVGILLMAMLIAAGVPRWVQRRERSMT